MIKNYFLEIRQFSLIITFEHRIEYFKIMISMLTKLENDWQLVSRIKIKSFEKLEFIIIILIKIIERVGSKLKLSNYSWFNMKFNNNPVSTSSN